MGIWACGGSCGAGVAVGCGTQPVSDRATRARSLGNGDMAGEGGGSWSWESAVVGGMVLVAGSWFLLGSSAARRASSGICSWCGGELDIEAVFGVILLGGSISEPGNQLYRRRESEVGVASYWQ